MRCWRQIAITLSAQAGARQFASRSGGGTSGIDALIVGAGHNGLVAATLLARQGLNVQVIEQKDVIGGACRTEYPFSKAPGLGCSSGAYLLGLFPPELLQVLGISLPLMRRDPHYFLPTTGDKYLLFGSDHEETRSQFLSFFSEQDWRADCRMQEELAALRRDIAPSMLREPLSLEETAARYVRPSLQEPFLNMCRQSIRAYLDRFDFQSALLKAMYAATDGTSAFTGDWNDPGTGSNFLLHQMCRLPGADGTWMVVKGGMGTVTQALARAALRAGAKIETGRSVAQIDVADRAATGVTFADGRHLRAKAVVVNADPFRLQQLVGPQHLPAELNTQLDSQKIDGSVLKVNLALRGLPTFSCLPQPVGQHRTTTHLLPDEDVIDVSMDQMFAEAARGQLPEFPTIELYQHTGVDPSLQDAEGHHNSALFVGPVPYQPASSSWDEQLAGYVRHLLSICDRFAPGMSDLVVDSFALPPPTIESHFGISRGHIHHVQNGTFSFDKRMPYATPIQGLYAASAGCHPGGSVIGCAGHNAAARLVRDLELAPCWSTA